MAKEKKNGAANGSLVFKKMGADFEFPIAQRKNGMYNESIDKLVEADGEVVVLYECPSDSARVAHVRRKALLMAAERRGVKLEAAVRNLNGTATLFAKSV